MQIGLKSKIGICALMSMGLFSGVCAIVRTVISMRVVNGRGHADCSWTTMYLRVWGTVEQMVGIIAACIPTLKSLYAQVVVGGNFSWSKGGDGKGYVFPWTKGGYVESGESPQKLRDLRPVKDFYETTVLGGTTLSGTMARYA